MVSGKNQDKRLDSERLARHVIGRKKEIGSLLNLRQKASSGGIPFREMRREIAYQVGEDTKKKVRKVLSELDSESDGIVHSRWPLALSSSDLLIWIIATAIRHTRSGARKTKSFLGATRLQKIVYFVREYKFPLSCDFVYEGYPHGVYSLDVADDLKRLASEGKLRLPNGNWVMEDLDVPTKFVMLENGFHTADQVSELLEDFYGLEEKQTAERLIAYLQSFEDLELLALASKRHFTWTYWQWSRQLDIEDFHQHLLNGAPSDYEEPLAWFMKKFKEYFRSREKGPSLLEPVSDVEARLQASVPGSALHLNRFFVFARNYLPTNYFFPVDAYKMNPMIVKQLAREVEGKIGPFHNIEGMIYLMEGIACEIAQALNASHKDLRILGPGLDRKTGNVVLDLRILKPRTRYVILASTTSTGGGLKKLIAEIQKTSAEIVKVVALCDRSIGAEDPLRRLGVSFEPLFVKDDLINLFKRSGCEWPLN